MSTDMHCADLTTLKHACIVVDMTTKQSVNTKAATPAPLGPFSQPLYCEDCNAYCARYLTTCLKCAKARGLSDGEIRLLALDNAIAEKEDIRHRSEYWNSIDAQRRPARLALMNLPRHPRH